MSAQTIGERIRLVRTAAGMSQGQMARLLGIAISQISFWERSRREPRASSLRRMASIFGVTLDWLIAGDSGVDHALAEQANREAQLVAKADCCYTPNDIARMLGVSRQRAHQLIISKRIRYYRFGNLLVIPPESARKLLAAREAQAEKAARVAKTAKRRKRP